MGPLIENLTAFGYDDKNLVALPVSCIELRTSLYDTLVY